MITITSNIEIVRTREQSQFAKLLSNICRWFDASFGHSTCTSKCDDYSYRQTFSGPILWIILKGDTDRLSTFITSVYTRRERTFLPLI